MNDKEKKKKILQAYEAVKDVTGPRESIKVICKVFGFNPEDPRTMVGLRTVYLTTARETCVYDLVRRFNYSYPEAGNCLGIHQSTARTAEKRMIQKLDKYGIVLNVEREDRVRDACIATKGKKSRKEVAHAVCSSLDIKLRDLRGQRRTKSLVVGRRIISHALYVGMKKSYPNLADFLKKNHTSGILAVRRFDAYLQKRAVVLEWNYDPERGMQPEWKEVSAESIDAVVGIEGK
jgi:hypothetical protein